MAEIITTEITATHFFKGLQYIDGLYLDDPVVLIRVPDHPKDANAIRVDLETGEQLGFIARELAAEIAPVLDRIGGRVRAHVSGLEGGRHIPEPRIRISFPLETGGDPETGIEYFADCSGHYAYIMLNGAENQIKSVADVLSAEGFICVKADRSHKPAADGRQYDWFIRVEKPAPDAKKPEEGEIDAFFKKHFNTCSLAGRMRDLQKNLDEERGRLAEIQQRLENAKDEREKAREAIELHKSEAETAMGEALEYQEKTKRLENSFLVKNQEAAVLREQRDDLRARVSKAEQRLVDLQTGRASAPRTNDLLEKTLSALFPKTQFLRNSFEFLSDLPDPAPVLKIIGTILLAPETVKSKRFEGSDCVFRSIRHPIPALFGSLIRSEATHWFKYTKGAGSGGSFPHRF
ncbi:MAG: hypothetical protein GX556_04345, partial [Fibrobacter sp.]|nr:hypothetical protein [Fibrobacter sp.]